ncbi:hypothetical protein Tco_0035975, partial [Tanacetum coccineum]
ITQPGMNIGQDRQKQMVRGIQNVGNQNRLIIVPGIANQNGNGNVVAARAKGNGNGNNGNQIRDCEEIEGVNANCILMENLQEALTSDDTLQHVVKSRISLNVNNWSSTVHQEVHKILKDEIAPIDNQVDARVMNFEKNFLKEAAKFV